MEGILGGVAGCCGLAVMGVSSGSLPVDYHYYHYHTLHYEWRASIERVRCAAALSSAPNPRSSW